MTKDDIASNIDSMKANGEVHRTITVSLGYSVTIAHRDGRYIITESMVFGSR